MLRPKRANRLGSTAMIRRASASRSHPMTCQSGEGLTEGFPSVLTLHRWPEPRLHLSIHEALHPPSPRSATSTSRKLFWDFQDLCRLHGAPLLLPSFGRSCPRTLASRSDVVPRSLSRSRRAPPARPGSVRCADARTGRAGSRRGVRPTSAPSPRRSPEHWLSSCGGMPRAERFRRSDAPGL